MLGVPPPGHGSSRPAGGLLNLLVYCPWYQPSCNMYCKAHISGLPPPQGVDTYIHVDLDTFGTSHLHCHACCLGNIQWRTGMQTERLNTKLSCSIFLKDCTTTSVLGGLPRPQNVFPTSSACSIPWRNKLPIVMVCHTIFSLLLGQFSTAICCNMLNPILNLGQDCSHCV